MLFVTRDLEEAWDRAVELSPLARQVKVRTREGDPPLYVVTAQGLPAHIEQMFTKGQTHNG